jgi:hypothetical protein
MPPAEGDKVLSPADQMTLRSELGKLMYQMQYSRPDIAQAVQDLAWYMTHGDSKILKAMRRCMRYVLCTRDTVFYSSPHKSGMDPTSMSSASEEDLIWTTQSTHRQDKV